MTLLCEFNCQAHNCLGRAGHQASAKSRQSIKKSMCKASKHKTEVFDNVRHGTKLITTSWALFMLLPGEASPSIQPGPKSPDGPPVATVPGLGAAADVHAADCPHIKMLNAPCLGKPDVALCS